MDGRNRGRVGELPSPDELTAHSPDAEHSVVGGLLANPGIVGDVIGSLLEPSDFYDPSMALLYGQIATAYYGDMPTDPVTIASEIERPLARHWKCKPEDVLPALARLAAGRKGNGAAGAARDHARVVKRHSSTRALLDLAASIHRQVAEGVENPEHLAGSVSMEAIHIATAGASRSELVTFDEIGKRVVHNQRVLQAARQQGVEVGAYFGLSFIDSYTRGFRPGELMMLGGDPGSGKSAIAWVAGDKFAERQLPKPKEKRIGTLVASLEMAEEPSSERTASAVTHIDGGKLREGRTDRGDLQKIVDEWHNRKGLPLVFKWSSTMRASQLRATVVEAINRHHVGVVIIDHFRYIDMDPPPNRRRWDSSLEAEEALARFLKQDIAAQLNVAVMCLAHTNKASGSRAGERPTLSSLRGGQLVAGHADYVAMVYRPYPFAEQEDINSGKVKRTDAEMHWPKNRHGLSGSMAPFFFDPSSMDIH